MTGVELIAKLHKFGFERVRQKGSHVRLKHSDGRCTTVPVHSGETIHTGLLHKIVVHDCRLTMEEFRKM
jgi:predicted RNA binding protein YcfA (HicA-like mRNA interferase family)